MISTLRYGVDRTLRLELPVNSLVANCDGPRGEPVEDVQAATRQALEDPLGFPPLAKAAVPGDRVALAVQGNLPQAQSIIAVTIGMLVEAGVDPSDVTVLYPAESTTSEACRPLTKLPGLAAVNVMQHDPTHREQLGFLATSHDGKPVYLNRAICDADLVVPIGCLRDTRTLGHYGISTALFPTFADAKTAERYRSPTLIDSEVQRKRFRKEADEVRWLLGVMFTIQVVPGAGGEILKVLAGDPDRVWELGNRTYAEAWRYEVPRRAQLVVASMGDAPEEQTWENVGRALTAALAAVADDGSIAICTELREGPGPGLQQLAGADDLQAVLHNIIKQRPADALAAAQLAHALERHKVYLLSQLDEDLVEDLGIAPVRGAEQVERLGTRHESCLLLANAQYATVTALDD